MTISPLLTVTISASNAADLADAVAQLAQTLNASATTVASGSISEDGKTAELNVETKAKPKRKTATRADMKAPDTKAPDTDAVEDNQEEAAAKGVVSDMTADQAREKAILETQKFFAQQPNALPRISKLQQKYGVNKFAEIKDAQAHDFLADVLLLVNGTPDSE